jgi:hypothetical protein
MTTNNTYLCSAVISDIFSSLANAFLLYRDEIDESQYRNNQHIEDSIINVVLQYQVITEPSYLPLIRELIVAVVSEPLLYAEWTEDDFEFFSEQMTFDFDDIGEDFPD